LKVGRWFAEGGEVVCSEGLWYFCSLTPES
jgi:hypothetical protein